MDELPNYSKGVVISILWQAAITGGLAGACILLALVFGRVPGAFALGLLAILGFTFIAWLVLLRYAILERWHVLDIHQADTQSVDQQSVDQQSADLQIIVPHDDQVSRGSFASLPCSREQFELFVYGVMAGASLAINYWSSSGAFTRSEFEKFRGALINKGLAFDAGSNKGLQLTRAGQSALKYYATVCVADGIGQHTQTIIEASSR